MTDACARAWDEGYREGWQAGWSDSYAEPCLSPPNPYRPAEEASDRES